MNELDIRIVKLEPMRVASVWAYGQSPELEAGEKLRVWATPRGLLDEREKHRIFGFDNPNPSAGSPNYGYELWIEVGPEQEPEGEARIVDFNGGLYAVARCPVPEDNYEVIGQTWQKLLAWRENSRYRPGSQQWLEENVPVKMPGMIMVLDLYIPLAE